MIEYLPSSNLPPIIEELSKTFSLERLKEVGMHCGLEYTSFPFFVDLKKYSRYDHSLGVAKIIYHFTKDIKQAISGLFHDISTPPFAHVVDFVYGDYDKQEATERKTKDVIISSKEIMDILNKNNISIDEVDDYHKYPLADNDSPKLSADRLEYSLSNFINFSFLSKEETQEIYDDISIGINEEGEEELMFSSFSLALKFGKNVLNNSKVYVSDPDRYSMERLARIIKQALDKGIVDINKLYSLDEPSLIDIFKKDEEVYASFLSFRKMHTLSKSNDKDGPYSFKISAKKRYIDPYIKGQGRLSKLDKDFALSLAEFVSQSFDYYLKAE